jgi:membrane protein implicated in regulation of membrane protease activity
VTFGKKKARSPMNKEKRRLRASVAIWGMRAATLALSLWAAFLVFFVIPINWKLYSQFTTTDWVWSWFLNISILVLALTLWWCVQRFLTRKIDQKTEPNQALEPTTTSVTPPAGQEARQP